MTNKFDYIVIGAGSAGCVLANRLSSSGKNQVLVLEAGGSDKRFWVQTPIGYGKTFYNKEMNWGYETESEIGLNNRKSYWPRGKIVGGSSSINAMVYIRGQHADYDDWAAMGNSGWAWNDVLPYFIKSETNSRGSDTFRGDSGPLYVNDPSDQYHPLCQTFLQAAEQQGLGHNPDFNGATQEGAGLYQITTKNGLRMSAARAYLQPALKRKNCSIETHAHVTRILFEGKKTIGVEFLKNGKIEHIYTNREVVLSGGTINSPQLLQLSGIGPKKLLSDLGINIIHGNESVGRNLQDHLALTHYYRSKVSTLNNQLSPWWGKLAAGIKYVLFRKGVLSLSVNQAGGFFKSTAQRQRPNLQLYFAAITYSTTPDGERPLMKPDPYPAFLNSICQCRPSSRGHLEIRSADPMQYPKIQPNYLSTEEDVQEMVEGFHYLRAMANTPALSRIIEQEYSPGLEVETEAQIIQDIKKRSDTVYHPTCTCTMGSDPNSAVVDARLRVHGVENLRVVDASIFPTIVCGNTNGPTIMVAEKASDMMLMED